MRHSVLVISCVITLAGLIPAQRRGTLPSSSGTDRASRSSQAANGVSPSSRAAGINPNAAPAQPSATDPANADIPADAAVITFHGLCSAGTAQVQDSSSCDTKISRERFETVLDAVSLGGQVFAPGAIRTVADTYAQNYILSEAALKSGV